MKESSARPTGDVEQVLERYGNMLYRLGLIMLKNAADAEDTVQETMLKYILKAPLFRDSEHEKAWLLKVAANRCRDLLRYRARHPQYSVELPVQQVPVPLESGILECLCALPAKYRIVLSLYYIEECRIEDIAKAIGRTPSAVRMRLKKGRELLAEVYRKEQM